MAIEFEVDEEKKLKEETKELQQKENEQAKLENRKPKKIKKPKIKKSSMRKWCDALLAFTVIGFLYAATYSISGIVVLIPSLFLWVGWIVAIILPTIVTFGAVWLNDGWKEFSSKFANFNTSISERSLEISEFLYKIFPYVASFFSVCVVAFLIVSSVGFSKRKVKKEGFTARFIVAIIFTVLFIALLVFDVLAYNKVNL